MMNKESSRDMDRYFTKRLETVTHNQGRTGPQLTSTVTSLAAFEENIIIAPMNFGIAPEE